MRLGLYTVHGEIGRGGMGVVYRARDPSGRDVAIKLLQARRDAIARFSREARLQDQLGETDGFVPLIDMGVSPHGPYIVMPLLDSGTLRDRIRANARFDIDDAVELTRSLAVGLGKAHARGIVHRDVKPDNVLFSARGEPLLADLGLAKHFRRDVEGASQSFALSRPGQARGTFGYMAPEQLSDAASSGPPADVYALGAVLYEVVTGVPAFQAATFVELMSKVAEGKVRHPRSLRPDCPAWLSAVIAKALAVDPRKRYPNGDALAAALVEPETSSRQRLILVGMLVSAALALGLAVWAYATRTSSTPSESTATQPDEPPPQTSEPAWTRLPQLYQELAKVESGPRLVEVWGHARDAGPVLSVAAKGDGALALEARAVRQWGGPLSEGLLVATPSPEQRFHTASLRPDLDRLLTSSDSVMGWELSTGSPLVELPLETPSPAVALSPNGVRGVLALEGTLFRFRLVRGMRAEPSALPVEHPGAITAVAASEGQDYLSASGSHVVHHSPRGSRELPHAAQVVGLTFLEPGSLPVTLDETGAVRAWESDAPDELSRAPDSNAFGPALGLGHGARGTRIAVGHLNGARVLERGEQGWREHGRVMLPADGPRLTSIAITPAGDALLVGTSRGAVLKFELAPSPHVEPELPRWAPLGHAGPTFGRVASNTEDVLALPSGEIVTASDDGWVCTWDPKSGELLRSFQAGSPLLGAKLRPGGRYLLTLGGGRCIRVWDLAHDPPAEAMRVGLEAIPINLAFSHDGTLAAVADLEGLVTVLDLEQRKRVGSVEAGRELGTLAILHDGRIAFGLKGRVLIYELGTGKQDAPRLVGGATVTAIEPVDERRFLVGTDDGAILMHSTDKESPEWITMVGGHAVRSLSLEAEHVLVGMRQGTLMRVRLEAGGNDWEVDGLVGPQLASCVLPKGRAAIIGTHRLLRVIDTASGGSVWPEFEGHLGPVDALSFVPGRRELVSAATDGARSWALGEGALKPGWRAPTVFNLEAAVARNGAVLSEELLKPLKPREKIEVGLLLHRPPPAQPLVLDVGDFDKVGISPDGKLAYTFSGDPDRAMVLDLAKDGQMNSIYTLGGTLRGWAFSADSSQIALATATELSLRQAAKGDRIWRVEGRADELAFLPRAGGGERLLCGHSLGGLELRGLEGGKLEHSLAKDVLIQRVCAVGPDRFLTLDDKDQVLAWDLTRGDEPVAKLDLGDPTDRPTTLAADLDTGQIAIGTGKGRVLLYTWGG